MTRIVQVRLDLTDEQHRLLRVAAAEAGVPMRKWIYDLVARELGGPAKPPPEKK